MEYAKRKGISEGGLKKNDVETTTFDGVDTKATLENPTSKKGWDGFIKENKSRLKQKLDKINRKGIKENGLK